MKGQTINKNKIFIRGGYFIVFSILVFLLSKELSVLLSKFIHNLSLDKIQVIFKIISLGSLSIGLLCISTFFFIGGNRRLLQPGATKSKLRLFKSI